jgi:hypothetical protein
MLTTYQFDELKLSEQIEIVEDFGVYLEVVRRSNGCKVALFALYCFYVEVYLKELTDTIVRIKPFTHMTRLEMYLDQIDITELID